MSTSLAIGGSTINLNQSLNINVVIALKRIFSVILFILAISCTRKEPVFNPLDRAENISFLKDGQCSCDFVFLSRNRGSNPGYIAKMELDQNGNIFVFDPRQGVLKYEANGKFDCQIGQRGRGPGEYISPLDFTYDTFSDNILILHYKGVSRYDTNGRFLLRYDLPEFNYDAVICGKEGLLLIAASPNHAIEDLKTPHRIFHFYSFAEKKIVKQLNQRKDIILNNNLVTQSFDFKHYIRPLYGYGDLLEVDESLNIISKESVSFGKMGAPKEYLLNNQTLDLPRYIMSNYYKMPLYFQDTERVKYFCAVGPDGNYSHFVFGKETGAGFYWEDKDDKVPSVIGCASDTDYLYFYVPDMGCLLEQDPEGMDLLPNLLVRKYRESAQNEKGECIAKIRFIFQ